jgi:hypothetical protein
VTLGAGIVDRNAEPAEPLHRLIDEVAHLLIMTNVGADELGFRAERAQLLSELGASVAMAARNDDLIAFAGESERGGAADSGERPGN